ncbi:MAG TPA: nucleotide pyrophosphohydrolase [Gemmataceae bacterium]|nr:nucleotide pyrophosphohydrolase [Gemmataceae bacterium]
MQDDTTTVGSLKEAVRRFAAERAWERYHSPKNLVMALAVETAELMEHFLWVTEKASCTVVAEPNQRQAVADELADVACLLFNLSLHTGIDLSDAVRSKMGRNALRYPVPKQG